MRLETGFFARIAYDYRKILDQLLEQAQACGWKP